MTVMIIGGDHLGSIDKRLKEKGFDNLTHFTGRKQNSITEMISARVDLVLVLTDYVGTKLSKVVKDKAKKHNVPVIFARRSWSCIVMEMERVCCLCCQKPCSITCNALKGITEDNNYFGGNCKCQSTRKRF